MSGVWRSGKGIASSSVDAKGSLVAPHTGTLGDEATPLLKGEVDVVQTESGKEYSFQAGDVIGLRFSMHLTWTSKGQFVKKLWLVTRAALPE